MKILLVYPEFPDTFWSFKHALRFIRKRAGAPPLGLLTVAAMLPDSWQLRLADLNIEFLDQADLQWADYVMISAMIVQKKSVAQVVNRCKNAGVKMIAGGPLFTMEYEHYPDIDHLILNEAELTLPPFLTDLENGCTKRVYSSDEYPDIHLTPAPLWHLAKLKYYSSVSVQFSRGCPFNCDFCNITSLLGHLPRTKNTKQIINELDLLYLQGWRGSVFFVDDNFICNKKQLKSELLPALIEWRIGKKGLPFNTEVSINLVDDYELVHLMTEAGFNTIFVGIETPNENSLAECNKSQNCNRDLLESVRILQESGLQVQGGFIVGFDSDTSDIFDQQVNFIQKSGIVTAMVGLLQAPVGTSLFDRMKKENRLTDDMSGNNTDGSTNIVPKMGIDKLLEGYHHLLSQIYSPKYYYKRIQTLLRQYPLPKINYPFNFQYLLAFWRSILRLGIIGSERMQYWKLFFWTLFRRPNHLPLAITLSIYGYHFRKIANSISTKTH